MQRSGCYLRAGVLGISYKTADLTLREEFARAAQRIAGERALFFKHPTILLSTCNRTEIYFSAEDLAEAHSDLLSFFKSALDESFEHRLYAYFGIDCFSHLSRVTAGLDSAILAETEIQRQVKLAYSQSAAIMALPSCIHYMFQKSLRIAKIARNSFSLARGASTLYGTLWWLAQNHLPDLKKARILMVGYSEINRGFAAFLSHQGIRQFHLVTRNPGDVSMEGAVVKGRDFLSCWHDFDWIICASKSEKYLIEGSGTGEQLIFDLSVPRTADPNIKGATLWNIEKIDQIVEQNRRLAQGEIEYAENAVQDHVRRLAKLYRAKLERAGIPLALQSS